MSIAKYEFVFTDDHFIEIYRRLRRAQKNSSYWFRCLGRLFSILVVGALLVGSLFTANYLISLVMLPVLIFLLLGSEVDYWVLKRRFRKNILCNGLVKIEFTEDGILGSDPHNKIEQAWTLMRCYRRFPDGFLLIGYTGSRWLPDSALVEGKVEEIEEFLGRKILNANRVA